MQPRPARNRATWTALIEELEGSELSQKEFADLHGLSVSAIRSWICRLRREERVAAPRMLPVRVVASTAPTARGPGDDDLLVEVSLSDGLLLRFRSGADLAYTAELIARLRSSR
jgi:hypothetical protein